MFAAKYQLKRVTVAILNFASFMNMSQRILNMKNIAQNSLSSPDPVSGIYTLQEWKHCWATVYIIYVHRLHGGPLYSVPLCTKCCFWDRNQTLIFSTYICCTEAAVVCRTFIRAVAALLERRRVNGERWRCTIINYTLESSQADN